MEKALKDMTKDEARLWFDQQRQILALERAKRQEFLWNNLPKIEEVYQVPDLPTGVSPEEWKEFYVKKLISAGCIPKEDLKDGEYYLGNHRRATIARWNQEKNKFEYNRTKFDHKFIDTCNHFEDDDGFALFVPIRIATLEQFERNAQ
jgi:hypothetical protein